MRHGRSSYEDSRSARNRAALPVASAVDAPRQDAGSAGRDALVPTERGGRGERHDVLDPRSASEPSAAFRAPPPFDWDGDEVRLLTCAGC